MRDFDPSTPVVVLNAKLAALGIMRSLGKKGVPVYAADPDLSAPAFRSRFCAGKLKLNLDPAEESDAVEALNDFARSIGGRAILFWTSDESATFCARNAEALSEHFLLPKNDPETIDRLQDKRGMYELAVEIGIPTPHADFPQSESDIDRIATTVEYPVMVKGIIGSRLAARTGRKMAIAESAEELRALYRELEDPEEPNLMIQEIIPGDDDQVYIYNGYFDENSECLNPYTGHKIRQFPIHLGCASLGICRWNERVARTTERFMKALGYRGILDIGYRLDPRDGQYKVLDVNPRIGQAFRIFVGRENEDVARDLYLDLTGQQRERAIPREGRKWMIEDFDFISSFHYRREGALDFGEWRRSLEGVEETAWWWGSDPVPFVTMCGSFLKSQIPRRLRGSARAIRQIGRAPAQV